jgi:hypothetical protein
MPGQPRLAHNVYFTLRDRSPEARVRLLDSCRHKLSGHPGTLLFAVGTRAAELTRPVNDRDFDVGLHIVFETKAAHDAYQESPRHVRFIEENRDTWQKVRVFDSLLEP